MGEGAQCDSVTSLVLPSWLPNKEESRTMLIIFAGLCFALSALALFMLWRLHSARSESNTYIMSGYRNLLRLFIFCIIISTVFFLLLLILLSAHASDDETETFLFILWFFVHTTWNCYCNTMAYNFVHSSFSYSNLRTSTIIGCGMYALEMIILFSVVGFAEDNKTEGGTMCILVSLELIFFIYLLARTFYRYIPRHDHIRPFIIIILVLRIVDACILFLAYFGSVEFCGAWVIWMVRLTVFPWALYWTMLGDSHYWRTLGNVFLTESPAFIALFPQWKPPTFSELNSLLMTQVPVIDVAFLEFGDPLGAGSFAAVYKGMYENQQVAIKAIYIDKLKVDTIFEFSKEAILTSQLNHPNLLSLLGVAISPPELCLVLDYCSEGSLRNYLLTSGVSQRNRLWLAHDVARGMEYLHDSCGVLHLDLNSNNVLVHKSESTSRCFAQVCDFGLSQKLSQTHSKRAGITPAPFCAPEILELLEVEGEELMYDMKHIMRVESPALDVYSFGGVVWQIYNGGTELWPKELSNVEVRTRVLDGERPDIEMMTERWAHIVSSCWLREPNMRPSFQKLVEEIESIIGSKPPAFRKHKTQVRLVSSRYTQQDSDKTSSKEMSQLFRKNYTDQQGKLPSMLNSTGFGNRLTQITPSASLEYTSPDYSAPHHTATPSLTNTTEKANSGGTFKSSSLLSGTCSHLEVPLLLET